MGDTSLVLRLMIENEVKNLKDAGVDLNNNNYYTTPAFKKLSTIYVYGAGVSMDWLIEKYIVGQDRLEAIYGCYDLRIERALTPHELSDTEWHKSLADRYPELNRSPKDIYQYFNRGENVETSKIGRGLIRRLKDWGVDVKQFSNDSERVRLLYFLYCFEVENKVQLGPFLNNPTLENVDNSLVGERTSNGELTKQLKSTISKALSVRFMDNAKLTSTSIAKLWENGIVGVNLMAMTQDDEEVEHLKCVSNILYLLTQHLEPQALISVKPEHSILETFYLKILLHEHLGRENDIIDVLQHSLEYYDAEKVEERYGDLHAETIRRDELEQYIKDHRTQIAQSIYRKKQLNSNEYRKFDEASRLVPDFVSTLDRNTAFINNKIVPVLMIYACIEDAILGPKETIPNHFYRYKTSDQKSINAEMKNGSSARRKNQMVWISRVIQRFNSYYGSAHTKRIATQIENSIDLVLKNIYQCSGLSSMRYISRLWQVEFNAYLRSCDDLNAEFRRLEAAMGKNYVESSQYVICQNQSLIYMLGTIFDSPITERIGKLIDDDIKVAEASKEHISIAHEVEMFDDEEEYRSIYELIISVDPILKKIGIGFVLMNLTT